jgi:cell division protein FtsI/penicillin-binding protein 2
MNEKKVTPETRCDKCNGPRFIGGFYIHTFNNQYHPNLTMTETLINSDNTGMAFVGEQLGFDNLTSYVKKFGFGQKTGVDLEEEANPELRKKEDFYEIDKATLTFGQGILVNALQMAKAFAALANGGFLPTPHFVTEIKTSEKTISLSWPKGQKIIDEGTAKTITEMLVQVCEKSPTNFPRRRTNGLDGFRIACKSGTAQIAFQGTYKEKGTTASVIGYFPANNPKYLIYVKLDEPEVRPWGSDTAGPVFFAIIRDLINYYGISP